MFKVSSILMDAATQSPLPLTDRYVNDMLVKVVPVLKQSFFEMISLLSRIPQQYIRSCKMPKIKAGN